MEIDLKSFLYGFLAGSGLFVLGKLTNFNKSKNKKEKKEKRIDFLFFSPQVTTLSCWNDSSENVCYLLSCPACNYKKLLGVIKNTKTRLDICMYLITMEELTNVIIKLMKKGVFVRIITDGQMSDEANNSKILVFLMNHIPIKIIKSSDMMHNKFVVIDEEKVITGSFNWTRQGLSGNFENGLIINDHVIVKKFSEYFQNLWLTPF